MSISPAPTSGVVMRKRLTTSLRHDIGRSRDYQIGRNVNDSISLGGGMRKVFM